MKFNRSKWIPFIFFIAVIVFLALFGYLAPTHFASYSPQISILSTLVYVYLTYEILRRTRQSQTLPYINVKFILTSKIDDDFLKNHQDLVINERVKKIIENFKKTEPDLKDLVFVVVENIGDTNAIEVKLNIKYSRRSFSQDSEQSILFNFGTLKTSEIRMELVDCFDTPTKNDSFKVNKCETSFNTVNRKYSVENPKKSDVSELVTSKNYDEGVNINFSK